MKIQKILVSAAIVCLLVGASGAAMAVNTCEDGVIAGTEEVPLEVDEIKIDGRSCFVNNVIVSGDVTVTNSEDFAMIDSAVKGSVRVLGCRNAIVVGNNVGSFESAETVTNLLVSRNDHAWVMLNIVSNVLAVNLNSKADVKKNAAAILLCAGNRRLDSFENEAAEQNCQALGQ